MTNYLNSNVTLNNIRNITSFIRKYSFQPLLTASFLIVVFFINSAFIFKSYAGIIQRHTGTLNMFDKTETEKICYIMECKYVYVGTPNNARKFTISNAGMFEDVSDGHRMVKIQDDIYLELDSKKLLLHYPHLRTYFEINYENYLTNEFRLFLLIILSILCLFFVLIYSTYKRERKEAILQQIGSEAILSNKSMIMITENVHHELNTPIEIIDNKVQKIHKVLTDYILTENEWWMENANLRTIPEEKRQMNKRIIKLEKDFEYIHTAFEQMFAVLNKMKNFKSLRYSNGDKTLFDIVEGAFKIISISNADFEYTIDPEFKNYRMNSTTFKNIDLINILINHIKNSLEANANLIEATLNIENHALTKNIVIELKDNGNGIPKHLVKNIFEPNLSTKAVGDTIRGNGMYLNKHIIQEAGGNISIKETSPHGTTVAITFPAVFKEYESIYKFN